jgi:hypothetical protein
VTTSLFDPGLFRVNLASPEVTAKGGWRVKDGPDESWLDGTNLYYPLVPGPFNIEFKPVPGYSAPASREVKVIVDQTTIIDAIYKLISLTPPRGLHGGGYLLTLDGGTGRVYSIQHSTDLLNWIDLLSLTNWTGTIAFTNAPDTGSANGFYRAKEQP